MWCCFGSCVGRALPGPGGWATTTLHPLQPSPSQACLPTCKIRSHPVTPSLFEMGSSGAPKSVPRLFLRGKKDFLG